MATRVRKDPRISLSKLAEYNVASPARRRSLLRDQKFPPAFQTAAYRAANAAIADVLIRGGDSHEIDEYIAEWRKRKPKNRFEADQLKWWIEALTAFEKVLDGGSLSGFSFEPGLHEAYLHIADVQVSIRPDALVTGPAEGAVKIYICKGFPLTPDVKGEAGSSSYAAALLHQWAESYLPGASPKACLVVDVFAGAVHCAPAHFTRRRSDLVAACEEIAARWASIKAPGSAPAPFSSPF